jgi:hypothetical protein
MVEFSALVVIVFSAFWGSMFLAPIARRRRDQVEEGPEATRLLREELDDLQKRLGRLEEEVEFHRKLGPGDRPASEPRHPSLPPGEERS